MSKQNQQSQQDKKCFPGQKIGLIRVLLKRPNLEEGVQLRFDLFSDKSNVNFASTLRIDDEHQSTRSRRRSNRASIHSEYDQLSFDLFPDETNVD